MTGLRVRIAAADIAAGLVALVFTAVCAFFAWQHGLASFADDSASYLVMAQVISPWQNASQAVAEAFVREAFYPPLFPLVLGLVGAGRDLAWAHVLTALLLGACLPMLYLLGIRWLGDRWAALAAMTGTVLLPSLWIHVKGILSEPLFILMLLSLFLALEGKSLAPRRLFIASLLMAALALTRTVGLGMVGAYALWVLSRRNETLAWRMRMSIPVFAAAGAYAAWLMVRPAEVSDDYMRIVLERVRSMLAAGDPWLAIAYSMARQAAAMGEAWAGAWLLFWTERDVVRLLLVTTVGLFALAGMALRFRDGKPDSWMSAAYLGTFLLWPFYDQMTRFLFPVLPVLLLYALSSMIAAARKLHRPAIAACAMFVVLAMSLTVPALAFIYQRAQAPDRHAEITDWYRTPNLDEARRRSEIHLDLMSDMEAIRLLTRPNDRVMWVTPSYIALLADRHGIQAPSAELDAESYRLAVEASGTDYVFLSRFHPRDTLRDTAWRVGLAALREHAQVIRARPSGSALLRMRGEMPTMGTVNQ